MRLLLDAHLSRRMIADPLRKSRHDVLALQEEPTLDGLDDEDVLAFAAGERRILITRNSRHFGPLTRLWAEAGRSHAGCILIWSYRHDEYASIIRGIEHLPADTPLQEEWQNLVLAI